jgi:hypothetical protein
VPHLFFLVFFWTWFLQCKRRHYHGPFQSCTNSAREGVSPGSFMRNTEQNNTWVGAFRISLRVFVGNGTRETRLRLPTLCLHAATSFRGWKYLQAAGSYLIATTVTGRWGL